MLSYTIFLRNGATVELVFILRLNEYDSTQGVSDFFLICQETGGLRVKYHESKRTGKTERVNYLLFELDHDHFCL